MNHTFSPKVANLWSSYSAARESFDFGEQIYSEILFVQQHRNDGASSTLIFLKPKLRKLINKYSLKRHYLKSRLFQWISRIWLLCVLVLGHFSHVQLFVIPWAVDCSLPGSSVWGILHERTLEWVAISSPRGSSQLRNWTLVSRISCTAGRFFFFFLPLSHWSFYYNLIITVIITIIIILSEALCMEYKLKERLMF